MNYLDTHQSLLHSKLLFLLFLSCVSFTAFSQKPELIRIANDGYKAVAFSQDGLKSVVVEEHDIRFRHEPSGETELDLHYWKAGSIDQVCISPDNRYIVGLAGERQIVIVDVMHSTIIWDQTLPDSLFHVYNDTLENIFSKLNTSTYQRATSIRFIDNTNFELLDRYNRIEIDIRNCKKHDEKEFDYEGRIERTDLPWSSLLGDSLTVSNVVFSKNGRFVSTVLCRWGVPSQTIVWDLEQEKVIADFGRPLSNGDNGLLFTEIIDVSATAKYVATVSKIVTDDQTPSSACVLGIWDFLLSEAVHMEKLVDTFGLVFPASAFSEDEKWFGINFTIDSLYYNQDSTDFAGGSLFTMLNLENKNLNQDFYLTDNYVEQVAFHPNGKEAILQTINRPMMIYCSAVQAEVVTSNPPLEQIKALTYSENGEFLAYADNNNTVHVRNLLTHFNTLTLSLPSLTEIVHVAISPDNNYLAVADNGNTVEVYSLRYGGLINSYDLSGYFLLPTEIRVDSSGQLNVEATMDWYRGARRRFSDLPVGYSIQRLYFNSNEELSYHDKFQSFRINLHQPIIFDGKFQTTKFQTTDDDIFKRYVKIDLMPWVESDHPNRTYRKIQVSSNGKFGLVVYVQNGKTFNEFWDLEKGELLSNLFNGEIALENEQLNVLDISPDGKWLAAKFVKPSKDNLRKTFGDHLLSNDTISINLISTEGKPSRMLMQTTESISAMAFEEAGFTGNGKVFYYTLPDLTASELRKFFEEELSEENFQAVVRNMQEERVPYHIQTINLEEEQIDTFKVSDNRWAEFSSNTHNHDFFYSSSNGVYHIIPGQDELVEELSNSNIGVKDIRFSDEGQIVIGTNQDIRKINLTTLQQDYYLKIATADGLKLNRQGNTAMAFSFNKMVRYDLRTNAEASFQLHSTDVSALEFHPQRNTIISGEAADVNTNDVQQRLLEWSLDREVKNEFSLTSGFQYTRETKENGQAGTYKKVIPADSLRNIKNLGAHALSLSEDGTLLAGKTVACSSLKAGELFKVLFEIMKNMDQEVDNTDSLQNAIKERIQNDQGDTYPGEIKLWRLEEDQWKEDRTVALHDDDFSIVKTDVAISPDKKYVAYSDQDGRAVHVDLLTNVRDTITRSIFSKDANIRRSYFGFDWDEYFNYTNIGVSTIRYSPDSKYLVLGDNAQHIYVYRVGAETGVTYLFELSGHRGTIDALTFLEGEDILASGSSAGEVFFWDLRYGTEIARIYLTPGGGDYVVMTPDNYYFGSKGAIKKLGFKFAGQTFPFEQFDLIYDRPDIVLRHLNSHFPPQQERADLAGLYDLAVQDRYNSYGFDRDQYVIGQPLPEVTILNWEELMTKKVTQNETISIKVRLQTMQDQQLAKLNIWVNDVPITDNLPLPFLTKPLRDTTLEVPVVLSHGENKVQVSVLDNTGLESLKKTFFVKLETEHYEPNLYFVGIGCSKYRRATDQNLPFPSKDVSGIDSVLSEAGMPYHALLLRDKKVTRKQVKKISKFLSQTREDDVVLFFVSGHGLRDGQSADFYFCTSDIDFDNPADRGIPYDEFDELLAASRSRKKILLLNSCYSGELAENEEVFRILHASFNDLRRSSGSYVFTASEGASTAKYLNFSGVNNGLIGLALMNAVGNFRSIRINDLFLSLKEEIEKFELVLPRENRPVIRFENINNNFSVWDY
ncbi:MAG: caspase family protein [Lewinella sp.]|nr:caspase family protein [Lewinella sp.]